MGSYKISHFIFIEFCPQNTSENITARVEGEHVLSTPGQQPVQPTLL